MIRHPRTGNRTSRATHRLHVGRLENLEQRLFLAAQAYDWDDVTIKANGFVDGIVYSSAAQNVLYMHTDMGGAYRWDQAANQWESMIDWAVWDDWSPQNMGVETLAADPTDASRVYMGVGTYNSPTAVMRSTDGGRTWLRTDMSFNSNGNGSARNTGERMNVDPNSPNILFYGTRNDGLWKSTNYGANWTQVASFPSVGETSGNFADTGVIWTLFDESSATAGNATQTIYAGVVNVNAGETRIYRTTNGGTSWEAVPGGQPTTENYFPQRAALTPDGNSLYLTYGYSTSYPGPYGISEGMVQKVTNPDAVTPTWADISPPVTYGFSGVALDPTNPATVYVTELGNYSPADRIWKSTAGGSGWSVISPNSNRDNSSAPYVNSLGVHWMGDLQIDPFNNNIAMFTTGMGLYRTTNLTAANPSWTFFNENFEQSAVLELISPNTGSVHLISAIGDRDGYRHDDFAQSPAIGRHGQNNGLAKGTNDDIDAAWDNANYTVRTFRSSPYVQYSLDNGITWQNMPSYSGSTSGSNWVAISADGTKIVYEPGGTQRVRYSTRSGSTWGSWTAPATNQPANGSKVVAELVAGSRTFYAYTTSVISRSTDGGANWTVLTGGMLSGTTWLRPVQGQAGHLIASRGSSGVWRGIVSGTTITWTQLGGGASVANQVAVGAGPTAGSYPSIFIGGAVNGLKGFFRSDDQGATWTQISDLAHNYGYVTVLQADPRVYGRLYVGTNGRGIQYADIHDSTPATLPAGWASADIGAVNTVGDAGESSGAWELIGGGAGISGTSDEFHFAYTQLTGDGSITARVKSVPNGGPTNYNAKAGVMIRELLTSGSRNAFVALTPGSVNGALFQTRASTTTSTAGSATTGIWPPYWVRLTRVGNLFTAFISPDGNNWTQLGAPQTIAMGSTVYVGLAATASDNNQVLISQYENVTLDVAGDTQAPQVTGASYHYNTTPNYVRFDFDEDVSSSFTLDGVVVEKLGEPNVTITPTGYTFEGNTLKVFLPTPLPDGNYRATLVADGITDAANNPLTSNYVFDDDSFFFLAADFNRDRAVTIADLGTLASNWQSMTATFSDGDANLDGSVTIADLGDLASRWQMTLDAPTAVLGSSAPSAPIIAPQPIVQPTVEPIRPTRPARSARSTFSTTPIIPASRPTRSSTIDLIESRDDVLV